MKKAFDLLNTLGLNYEFHDYKKQGIDAQHLQQWLQQVGAEIILNKKGTTWRKLDENAQQTALSSQKALVEALISHSSMIKRPILETPNGLIVGFDENQYRALTH